MTSPRNGASITPCRSPKASSCRWPSSWWCSNRISPARRSAGFGSRGPASSRRPSFPIDFTNLPTSGNGLTLQGVGALLGILLWLNAISPAFVAVGYDPHCRGWRARTRSPPAAVTFAGARYAVIWILATVRSAVGAASTRRTRGWRRSRRGVQLSTPPPLAFDPKPSALAR
jgi:hypothetical protein